VTTVVEWSVLGLVAASVFFSVVAAVGFYRLPDVYARTHAASKSETLGALLGLAAVAVVFATGGDAGATVKVALLALFVLVTGPTAAHAIARAAADAGIEPWTRATAPDDGADDALVADGGRVAPRSGGTPSPRNSRDPRDSPDSRDPEAER
jgi:multicomponent Na+:H+ antiporter subunit G